MTGRRTFLSTLSFSANMSGDRPGRAVANIDTSVLRAGSHRRATSDADGVASGGARLAGGHSGQVGLGHGERNKLSGRVETDLLADVLAMIVDREDTQVQRLGDLPAGLPLTNVFEDLEFPARERVIGLHS